MKAVPKSPARHQLASLEVEHALLRSKVADINSAVRDKQVRKAQIEGDVATAEAKHAGEIAAYAASEVSDAPISERKAIFDRVHAASQARRVAITAKEDELPAIEASILALNSRAQQFGARLLEINQQQAAAVEARVREVADELHVQYLDAAAELCARYVDLYAVHRLLAGMPGAVANIANGATEQLVLPVFSTVPSAASVNPLANGFFAFHGRLAPRVPEAVEGLRERLQCEGLSV